MQASYHIRPPGEGYCAGRHITANATLLRLCGQPHNRSITFNARRYRDEKTGEWKDAASYRPVDLATLEMALGSVRQFIASTPLPGQPVEGDELEELHGNGESAEESAT